MNHAAVSPSTMPVGRMPQTTKSTIMATSQGMPAPEDIRLSDLMLEELLDLLEGARWLLSSVAELRRASTMIGLRTGPAMEHH